MRNYTIVGNYKIGFPQWRLMRCVYPESGPPVLRTGDEVYVLGRSQKRGYLVVEFNGQQMHLPHHFTELRVSRDEGTTVEPLKNTVKTSLI